MSARNPRSYPASRAPVHAAGADHRDDRNGGRDVGPHAAVADRRRRQAPASDDRIEPP